RKAPDDVVVAMRELVDPADGSGREVQGDDRVGARIRGVGVGVAGADEDEPAFGVYGRRRPDGASRRAIVLLAGIERLRCAWMGIGLPEQRAGAGVECDQRAAEFAALVAGLGCEEFLPRRNRDVDVAVVKRQ